MGPPRFAPNWLRLKGDCGSGSVLKKLRASSDWLRMKPNSSPWRSLGPDLVAMFTTAPELRPYSALSEELSTLNSDTVLMEGWNVIWFWTWSFRLTPLIMKLTVSSRLPAVL